MHTRVLLCKNKLSAILESGLSLKFCIFVLCETRSRKKRQANAKSAADSAVNV